jgi:hypothetical protein
LHANQTNHQPNTNARRYGFASRRYQPNPTPLPAGDPRRDGVPRGGLVWSATGELAYFVGCMGVLLDPRTGAQRLFGGPNHNGNVRGHTAAITCLALDPSRRFAATGQRAAPGARPFVLVWDVRTLKVLVLTDY